MKPDCAAYEGRQQISRVVGVLAVLYGITLALAGGLLLVRGGTPYYFLAGMGTVLAGAMVAARRRQGAYVYIAVILGSLVWAYTEVGFALWLFLPRVAPPLVIGLLLSLPWLLANSRRKRNFSIAVILAGVAITLAIYLDSRAEYAVLSAGNEVPDEHLVAAEEWPSFANGNAGLRFSTAQQITTQNVQRLDVAWIHRSGEDPLARVNPRNLPAYEATPIKIGSTLYICTPRNQIIAVDAENGTERWRHDPQTDTSGASYLLACRGVSYFEIASGSGTSCARRIIAGTGDGRLIALDADSGKLCPDFGDRGTVSLRRNLGDVPPGSYSVTSAPLVTGATIIVGALVADNLSLDVPSGVVRAYDAESGRQLWSFDTGAAEPTLVGEPAEEFVYTRGSPNAWAPFSADEERGLVFIPTGNASPDYFAVTRNPAMARFGSSVLALEVGTGRLRWVFQTVHHDVWDYDVAAQPLLIDFPTPQGPVPALIQPTKRGDLFVLDRRSGEPLMPVDERAVPQRGVPEDSLSPTQPFSVGMPFLGSEPRTEAAMWGVTPFDQIWCRLRFRELHYEGPFTPPAVQETLQSPNQTGASNWGRVSIDPIAQVLVANTVNLDSIVRLIPRADVRELVQKGTMPVFPQEGTPYASSYRQFFSPLGIPCNAPPWGEIRAIDLASQRTLWRRPFGTVRDRLPVPLPIELGMPNVGGPLTTTSGLTFIAAVDDGYLRAYETRTGGKLWSYRLPASAQAAPMTYVSRASGRQFIVIAAGGDVRLGSRTGDYLVAFALPEGESEP